MQLLTEQHSSLTAEQQFYSAYQVTLEENEALKTENKALKEEINRLKEQLALAQHRQFGKKSELGEEVVQGEAPTIHVGAHTRKKKTKGRLIDLSSLPRYTIIHDLMENEKNCTCCHSPLKRMGEDISEQLEVLPQRLYVQEHVRYKYACCLCEKIRMAEKEKAPIPKALAGGSLLTEVILNKYQYHLPLYRQSKLLASYGALIPDNTLGNWVMQVGEGLMPLYDAFWEILLAASYLQVDETPIKILNPNKKRLSVELFCTLSR